MFEIPYWCDLMVVRLKEDHLQRKPRYIINYTIKLYHHWRHKLTAFDMPRSFRDSEENLKLSI